MALTKAGKQRIRVVLDPRVAGQMKIQAAIMGYRGIGEYLERIWQQYEGPKYNGPLPVRETKPETEVI